MQSPPAPGSGQVPKLGPAWNPAPHPAGAPHQPVPPPPAPSVIAVCSGKGGVGKSSLALNLAVALAAEGERIGLLDADVHAPDLPLMVGLARRAAASHWTLARAGGLDRTPLEPVDCYGVRLMSTGFVVGDVAHLDTRRLLTMLGRAGVDVVGGIENMSGLTCPHCGKPVEVFAPVAESRSVWSTGLRRLGSVPLAAAGAGGDREPVVRTAPSSPQGTALHAAALALRQALAA